MAHEVIVVEEEKWADKPWLVYCSCKGPEGRFATQFEAEGFAATHVSRRGGTVTVKSKEAEEKSPALPAPEPVASLPESTSAEPAPEVEK